MTGRKKPTPPVRPRLGGHTTGVDQAPDPARERSRWLRWIPVRRRAVADSDIEGEGDQERSPTATSGEQISAKLTAGAIRISLALALVCGPLSAAWLGWAATNPAPTAAIASAEVADPAGQAAAEEMAQRVVVAWLGATREDSEELYALVGQADGVTLPKEPQRVSSVRVASITADGPDFSVVVAATVTAVKDEPLRRYFQVPVRVEGESVAVLTLPAPVTGPTIAAAPNLAYREQLATDPLLSQTVEQFLAAYLTGVGDVSRYLTPGTAITAIEPALASDLTIDDITGDRELDSEEAPTDGDTLQVLVTATGTVSKTQSSTVTYALSLTARAGRWEVTSIDFSPLIGSQTDEGPAPDLDPSTDSTQSTTTP